MIVWEGKKWNMKIKFLVIVQIIKGVFQSDPYSGALPISIHDQ